MKQTIKVTTADGKSVEGSMTIRNLDHFEVQKATRAHIFKPKKGKGSFKRNKRCFVDE